MLLRAAIIAFAAAAWLALIYWPQDPQRREDMGWHGRNTPHVPPPVPDPSRHPAADDQVR